MSKPQAYRLDCARQAAHSAWSPSREELGDVDLAVDDAEPRRQPSPDADAIKGRTQPPETRRRSSLPSTPPSQALLSRDATRAAGGDSLIGVVDSPKESETIGDALLEEAADASSREVAAAATSVGKRAQQALGLDVKAELDEGEATELSKRAIEAELSYRVERASGRVDRAEAAAKAIKRRVRAKSSSLARDVDAAAPPRAAIGAALVISRATREGDGERSAYKALSPRGEASLKRLYSSSPSDLAEATTRASNSTQRLRAAAAAAPSRPSVSDSDDWELCSLETGGAFARDCELAREAPRTREARLRVKRLASLDPISADDEAGVDATPTLPVERRVTPKRLRPTHRRRRHQRQGEIFGPEPENDSVINACLASSFQESADFVCSVGRHIYFW